MRRLLSSHCLLYLARSFISAVLVVYLVGQGISLSTISLAKATQLLVSIAFNVVGGKVSDRFGSRSCALLSCVSSILYFLLMIDPTEAKVIMGEALNGLAIALYKGAYEAWSFKLKATKEPVVFILFRSNETMFVAMMVAGVLGAFFASQALVISILVSVLACFMFALTPEPRERPAHIVASTRLHVSASLRRFDVYLYVFAAGLTQLIYQYWPIYLMQASGHTLSQQEIGWAFGGGMCAQALVTRYVRQQNYVGKEALTKFAIGLLLLACGGVAVVPVLLVGKEAAVASYIFFATAAGLYLGLIFGKICAHFNSTGQAAQLISWVDAMGRSAGAAFLTLMGVFHQESIGVVWALLFGIAASVHLLAHRKQHPSLAK